MTPPERLQDVTLAERLLEMCREPDGTEMPGHAEPWGADVATLREAAAALSVRGDAEIRLWDSQWVNVVNHDDCYRDWSKEAAIAHAVRMTETYMRKNYDDARWPPRIPPGQADATPPSEG